MHAHALAISIPPTGLARIHNSRKRGGIARAGEALFHLFIWHKIPLPLLRSSPGKKNAKPENIVERNDKEHDAETRQ